MRKVSNKSNSDSIWVIDLPSVLALPQSDTEVVEIMNNNIGEMGPAAITVEGDVKVTITGNTFGQMGKQAFKVSDPVFLDLLISMAHLLIIRI